MRCLEQFELFWDDEIDFQSRHLESYQSVLTQLIEADQVYACSCNRKQLAAYDGIYPQICRTKQLNFSRDTAIRLKTHNHQIRFLDGIQSEISCSLLTEQGDFVVKRKDGFFAYQLAVVVDDYRQGITNIVRGFDLLESTPRQIYLQQLMGYPIPHYSHIPIIVDAHGQKLSKQTQAEAVQPAEAQKILFKLLQMLRQDPPTELRYASITEILEWGIRNWRIDQLQNMQSLQIMPIN